MSSPARLNAAAAAAAAAPRSGSPAPHALQGRLEDLPLPDIMQVVQSMAKTGARILKRADGARAISVFRKGRLVLAATDEAYETLGDRLVRTRAVSRDALNESLRYMTQFPGMRVGMPSSNGGSPRASRSNPSARRSSRRRSAGS